MHLWNQERKEKDRKSMKSKWSDLWHGIDSYLKRSEGIYLIMKKKAKPSVRKSEFGSSKLIHVKIGGQRLEVVTHCALMNTDSVIIWVWGRTVHLSNI